MQELSARYLRLSEGFRLGPLNAANQILSDRTPLPWQRNFEQNWL